MKRIVMVGFILLFPLNMLTGPISTITEAQEHGGYLL